jgi:hypothetical protein
MTRAQASKRKIGETSDPDDQDSASPEGSETTSSASAPAPVPVSAPVSAPAPLPASSDVQDEGSQPTQAATKKGRRETTNAETQVPEASNRNNNGNGTTTAQRRTARKKQKTMEPPLPESEYTEIEYVNQVRQKFTPKNGLAGELPPIHDLNDIFEKITLNAVHDNRFERFIKSLNGRKLRVATVCSGTESPILALEMIISRKSCEVDFYPLCFVSSQSQDCLFIGDTHFSRIEETRF